MTDDRRIIVYSNEMVGLGHLRRTLSVVERLGAIDSEVRSLILTGSSIEPFFALPERCDTLKLPTRRRDAAGNPGSRLDLDVDEMRRLRSEIALAAAQSFGPQLVLVDKLPLGLDGELEPTLKALRADPDCRLVLGLRDIEDSPANVRRKWDARVREALRRYYDAILVYGPASTPDALACLGWEDLPVPVTHVGYVSRAAAAEPAADLEPGYLLATTGGGHDGFRLLATLAQALRRAPAPCPVVMVTGPLIDADDAQRLRRMVAGLDVRLFDFRCDMTAVIAGARAVVSMAGYNTVAEVMRAGVPALLVPRVRPSEEQLVRAQRLVERGLHDMLHPDDLDPATLRRALDRLLERPRLRPDLGDFQGAERAAEVLRHLNDRPATPRPMCVSPRPTREGARIAVVASGFPRVSETFALNELLALDAEGRLAALFATKPGEPDVAQPGAERLLERVQVLPDATADEQAAVVAERLRGTGVTGVHGYFAHRPAEVAAAAARALGVPFGFSVHARDARKVAPAELEARARSAACIIACNDCVAREIPGANGNLRLIRHGVDLRRFAASAPRGGEALRLLAVGRLVEKKGFAVLIEALALLAASVRLRIVGDGPLRGELLARAAAAGVSDRVDLAGARTHEQLPSEYAAADVVVTPSIVDRHGDCDGLPNVVLESMASARPVVASAVADLPSAIADGETGLLVKPGDPAALAAALDRLRRDGALRRRLGAAARRRVEADFQLEASSERFVAAMESAYA